MKTEAIVPLSKFLKDFWFVPSDVLQRTIEALLWAKLKIRHPVLEIGCGDGKISRVLFASIEKIDVAIDKDEGLVEKARRISFYKKVLPADASDMPLPDSCFQTVVANSTFEHIEKDVQAVAEVGRILKENGIFALTIPSKRIHKVLAGTFTGRQEISRFNRRLNHWHYRTLKEWEKILKKASLEIIKSKYYLSPKLVNVWLRLFRVFTTRIYHREVWSYLQDVRFRKCLPERLIVWILVKYFRRLINAAVSSDGCFLFIVAQKRK